jgi:hypothetical protein
MTSAIFNVQIGVAVAGEPDMERVAEELGHVLEAALDGQNNIIEFNIISLEAREDLELDEGDYDQGPDVDFLPEEEEFPEDDPFD